MHALPVRSVALYKHGVAYFEREAEIEGSQALTLTFRRSEVSDVLKSLTVLDLDGGHASAVSYDSSKPVEQLLAEVALTVPDSGSLSALLPQLKGARVAVGDAEGMIVGIDQLETRTQGGVSKQTVLSVVTDAGDMRSFPLHQEPVRLLDEGLRRDLDFALRAHLSGKRKDARDFTLFAEGDGRRRVRVSYVVESPVWKATYRILLKEPGHERPMIQGWAVLDNMTEEDWEGVNLSLVAGLPVSFRHDLDSPRYVRRPEVAVQETAGVLPPLAEAGVTMAFRAAAPTEIVESYLSEFTDETDSGVRYASMPPRGRAGGASSVLKQTRERAVGDLFEYVVERPVTVRRNQSALVPIVLKEFDGRSVLLYQKEARKENPIRCVEFHNATGLTLEGGPVTVLEAGDYVGEAMLDTLRPGEQRLVGYSVELAVRVLDNIDTHEEEVRRAVIRKGQLHLHAASVRQTAYTFDSKADGPATLYLDHPREAGWKLIDTAEPHEVTENYWRFRFDLPADQATRFVVKQRKPTKQTFAVVEAGDRLEFWLDQRYFDPATAEALKKVLAERAAQADIDRRVAALREEGEAIAAEQKRIRENLGALGDRSAEKDLRDRYVKALSKQEDRLEEIAKEVNRLRPEAERSRAKVAELLAGLEYDAEVTG